MIPPCTQNESTILREGATLGSTAEKAVRQIVLGCGILAASLYVAMMFLVGVLWDEYSSAAHTISELSAIGAPTRQLWILLGAVYSALMVAFGWTVWRSAAHNLPQRVVGVLLMIHAIFGSVWPPMHQREVLAAGGATLTDSLHIVWAAVTGLFFMLETGFGAAMLGTRFRFYSVATMVIGLACGAMTGRYTAEIQANLPTPVAGAWERIGVTAYMVWIAVLAIALMREPWRRPR
jgi:hypothetical protein